MTLIMPVLASCHGSRGLPEFVMPEEFDESKNYEITFWAKNDTNKNQTAIYEKAIADFQEIYPNVSVKIRFYTDYGKIYNDVITNISTNTTPNVCITYPDHIATYMTGQNVVAPLDELMANGKYGLGGNQVKFDAPDSGEMIAKFMEECKLQGIQYAIPYMRSTEICYVNKDQVEKLGFTLPEGGITWDFIFQVSEAAMAKDSEGNFLVNDQKVMIPFIYKSTDNMMIQMLRQKGAGYSTEDGEIQIFNDTTRELLSEISEHGKTGAFSTFKISSYPGNFLNAGQCIFAVDSSAGATWMGSHAPMQDIHESKIVEFDLVTYPVPQFDPANPVMISQGPSICIFNKADPGEVLASWLFTQFLLTNDVQIAYAKTEGYVPVTSKAQEAPEYREYLNAKGSDNKEHYATKIEATEILIENTENTFTTPVFNGSTSLRDASGQMIENVTKSVRRGETVDDAYIDNLFEQVTSLYRLDQIGESGRVGEDLSGEPLPGTAKALLGGLGIAWVLIIVYWLMDKAKKRG
ncbi:MAG: extracellular solute-binding protein [Firmicutes bacterium]|nr:extracellular solute-binding protein [Bacillota bacterium]